MGPAAATALALISSACWSGLDALRKHLAGRFSAEALVVWLSLGQVPLFGIWWALEGGLAGEVATPAYGTPALAALALNVVANLAFVRAVHISDLSATVPMMAFSPVFSALVAYPLLGELPGAWGWLGIGAVVGGAIVLHAPPLARAEDGVRGKIDRGALLMLAAAAGWSSTAVLDKVATAHAPMPLHALLVNLGVGAVLMAYLGARGRAGELRGQGPSRGLLAAAVLVGALAFGTQLLAIQGLWVGAVETIKRAFGMLAAIVVGRLAFGEEVTPRKILAALLMAGGAAAIMLGS